MLHTSRVVIAVMGATGAGKSSFIKRVTGRDNILVEDSLSSGTEEVKAYDFNHGSTKFTLVDTPGFDDSRSSDQIIIGKILTWLHESYCEDTLLNGLIFMHRISDPKMGGTALANLRIFRQLCGPDCLKNVVLATTFWGSVNKLTGEGREKELVNNDKFWGKMVAKGSEVIRLDETQQSNMEVLLKIAKNNGKVVTEAQKEMVAGKSKLQTSAAQEVDRELNRWELEKEQELAAEKTRLQIELEKEKAARELLKRQRDEADRRIREARERDAKEEREREEARARELKKEREEREAQRLREESLQQALREAQERAAQEERERELARARRETERQRQREEREEEERERELARARREAEIQRQLEGRERLQETCRRQWGARAWRIQQSNRQYYRNQPHAWMYRPTPAQYWPNYYYRYNDNYDHYY